MYNMHIHRDAEHEILCQLEQLTLQCRYQIQYLKCIYNFMMVLQGVPHSKEDVLENFQKIPWEIRQLVIYHPRTKHRAMASTLVVYKGTKGG